MTTSPEHINAVAEHLALAEGVTPGTDPFHAKTAEALLNDPALIPAMLDALTRHGALTQQLRTNGVRLVAPWREIDRDEALALLRERLTGGVA